MQEDISSLYDLRFDILYYGADYPVDSLVRKMELEEIYVPNFQRQYVWKKKEASQFIESILLGLPIPTIFLAKDKYTNQLLIVDGQQRLLTLKYFVQGYPDGDQLVLEGVIPQFEGKTFQDLDSKDQYNLMDFTLHAIVIAEKGDNNRMYYLFERLNTTGNPLTPQEIRNAIYHGPLNDLLRFLSSNQEWQKQYGVDDRRLKGQELILRFFAFYFDHENFRGDIKTFLNRFMLENRTLETLETKQLEDLFTRTVSVINEFIGVNAFKFENYFNTGFFDTVMLTIARNITDLNMDCIPQWHKSIKSDKNFKQSLANKLSSNKVFLDRLAYSESKLEDAQS